MKRLKFSLPRRIAARIALALMPVLPASQSPVTDLDTRSKAIRADEFDESEVETGCSPQIFNDGSRYAGPRTGLSDQLAAVSKMSGRGGRFHNSSLVGDGLREERERFIATRMRGD